MADAENMSLPGMGKDVGNSGKTTKRLGGVTGKGFMPGQSGNPAGRPPKSLMQRELERLANDPTYVAEWLKATKKRMMAAGVAGFLQSREVQDRVDGPVTQSFTADITTHESEVTQRIINGRKRLST